jgi:multidrug efflux pump
MRRLAGNRPLKLHGGVPHDVEDFAPAGDLSVSHAGHGNHGAGTSSGGGGGLRPQPAAPRHPDA